MRGRGNARPAGGSAQLRYEVLTKAWRRRHRKAFVVVGLIVVAVCVVSAAVGLLFDDVLRWFSGVVCGMAIAFITLLWASPPGWIENWQTGARGEQRTGKLLKRLERTGWVVLHDLPGRFGNIDHVVVGPGGVFLLDSKVWSGDVVTDGDRAVVRHHEDSNVTWTFDGSSRLKGLAVQVRDQVHAGTRATVWVTPVVVLWSNFPQGVGGDRVAYVAGERLAAWLTDQPVRMAPNRVQQVVEAIRRGFPDVDGRAVGNEGRGSTLER